MAHLDGLLLLVGWLMEAIPPSIQPVGYLMDIYIYMYVMRYIYIYMVPPPPKKNYVHLTFAGICNILCLFLAAFWTFVFGVPYIYIFFVQVGYITCL